nr:RNA polymerase sigma factor [Halalkalibaculum roseum]
MESKVLLDRIIKGCCKRRRKSQKKLYKMFYGYGMSITLRYAESREEAAEILNDAFMKVFTNIKDFDIDKPFKPWLRRIIINTAINHYHRTKKYREMDNVDFAEQSLSTREQILPGISYDEIIEMVQQLTPAYRTVFNLYVIEGFKHREIAEMLGIAVGTSKSNLAKAKRNLQAILEKNFM